MEEQIVQVHKWLYPLSAFYGLGVAIRNKLFDWGVWRTETFDMPTICIGNLAVGGTGKTPHTEYLIEHLQSKFQVAVLSRGYKRQTRGFQLGTTQSTVEEIGDEPYQMLHKYPRTVVAVDTDRRRGITKLMELTDPRIDVILLDDAYQHRHVEAGISILLTDYHRLFCYDTLLPAGRLREPAFQKLRAQMIIVTKCPTEIKPIDFNIIGKHLKLRPYQHLLFSTLQYGQLTPLFPDTDTVARPLDSLNPDESALVVAGIASPDALVEELQKHTSQVHTLDFGDHHVFKKRDFKLIADKFATLAAEQKLIVTTEKDAVRLRNHPELAESDLRNHIYVLPIQVKILQDLESSFIQTIENYVSKNSRDRKLPQRKNAGKA